MSLSETLVAVTSALTIHDLPDDVVRAAESSLLDSIGVSLAATTEGGAATRFTELVLGEGGREDATVFGTGRRVPAAAAAYANGALSHALDYEDSIDGLPIHPNAQSIPALLALAEHRNLTGERLLTSIAIACDITARLASAAGTAMGDRGWYPPPILGALGATIGAAHLVGLDTDRTLDALSLAISQATASGQVKHSPDSLVRGVRDGFAAHAAVRSVELAELGITGFIEPLEGAKGFFATYAGDTYDPDAVLGGLGEEFWGRHTSYKPWPSCRGTHSFIEGALALRNGIRPEDIERVDLLGAPVNVMLAEPHEAKARPTEAINAKFSLPFTVATALVDGDVTFDSFTPDGLSAPAALELAQRVHFIADPTKDTDASMTHGAITIRLTDGRSLHHDVRHPLGNPASPLSTEQLRDKFIDCATRATTRPSRQRAAELADRILAIRGVERLRDELPSILTP